MDKRIWIVPLSVVILYLSAWAENGPGRLFTQMLCFPQRQAPATADTPLGHEGALHSRPGLVARPRTAEPRKSASIKPAGPQQRVDWLLQRRRKADLGHGLGAVSRIVSGGRTLPARGFPARRPVAR